MVESRWARVLEITALAVIGVAFYAFVATTFAVFAWMLWQLGGWWLSLLPVLAAATGAAVYTGVNGRRDV